MASIDAGPSLGLENLWLFFAKNTLFLAKNPPPPQPPGLELLMEDLEISGLKLVKNTPHPNENLVRTLDFEFWVAKNTLPPQ